MELKRYLEIIWRRKLILAQTIGVIVGFAVSVSLSTTPIYNASANVLIKTEDLKARYFSHGPISPLPPDLGTMNYIEPRNVVDTYIALAGSSPILGKVIRELSLKDQKGKVIEVKDFIISIPRFSKLIFTQKRGVRIKRMKAAEILEITGYSTGRKEAAEIANSVAGAFSDFIADLWRQEASSVRRLIEKQLSRIELFSYFAGVWHKIEDERKNLTERKTAESAGIKEMVLDVDERVSALVTKIADLELEKSALWGSAKEQANVLARQIDQGKDEVRAILRSSQEVPRFMGRLSTLGEAYNYLKARLEYVKIAESAEISNVVTVQSATLSLYPANDIYFPKKGQVLIMSLLVSMSFGIFLCFLLEYLDDTIKTAEAIKEKLSQPVLGIVRMAKRGQTQDREAQTADFYGDFWDIRSNIKIATSGKSYKTLAITSALKGEGKSTISRYLAEIFVESGLKVLLIDMNFRRPSLHRMLNLLNYPGLVNFLNGENKIKEIISSVKNEGGDFIPAGPVPLNPLKMIDSANMLRFIQTIRPDYDLIICDTPAIEDGSDSAVIGSFVDNVIFVVDSGHASPCRLKRALEIAQKANTNILGVVLNKAVK